MAVARYNRTARLIAGSIRGHLLPSEPTEPRAPRNPTEIRHELDLVNTLREEHPDWTLLQAVNVARRQLGFD
jgi:hypothetical protein